MSMLKRVDKKKLLIWAVLVPLAICLVYSLFYLASSIGFSLFVFSNRGVVEQRSILSGPLDIAVWGIAIFVILARLGYDLELNMVKGYYRSYAGVGLLVAISSMAVGAVAVILGFIGTVALVPISVLLLSMCVVFSSDFFGVDRLPFSLRLLVGGLIIGVLVELAGILV
jgi:hypothetical protein